MSYTNKQTMKVSEMFGVLTVVLLGLCLGAIIAVPIIMKMEIGFALIDFLNRH